ncbi:MAG: hypothetical protein IKB38_07480 [Clostridia bacterium]|nr:hypothetical protein [Clostridia bacterium]
MPKSNLMRIILVVASVLIVFGVVLTAWSWATRDERNVIEVRLRDRETQTVKFENLCLLPGEECEYTLKLEPDGIEQCDLKIDFIETKERTLKNFAYVRIEADGTVIFDDLMARAFDGEPIILPVDFDSGKNAELTVTYYLPLDVGNEAQSAEAIFELQLTASNE